jgi:hypothetical protein
MGCGDMEGGEAWTFTCPPGHRVVGYAGNTDFEGNVGCIRFFTACFEEAAEG